MARAAIIPQSPPKRTTRGRPKASTTTAASRSATTSTATSTKPVSRTARTNTTASAVVTRKRTTRTATATSSTRKQANSDSDEATDDELGVDATKEKSKPGRPKAKSSIASNTTAGRGRKPTTITTHDPESENDDDELAQSDAPKKRPGRPRTKPAPKEEEQLKQNTAPRPRGRPRATTASKPVTTSTAEKDATKKKTTRVRTTVDASSHTAPKHVVVTTNSTIMRSNLLRGPAKKKKVTFQDVSDSEEEEEAMEPPTTTTGRRRAAPTSKGQVGLGAQPVRKPATTTGRGRKPAATKKEASKPLSPKKANQVAKSISSYVSSDGEDDELSGTKDQFKLTVSSPLKHGSENTGLSSPVRKINFTPSKFTKSVDENGEPTLQPTKSVDFGDSLFMSSPAKRPTPSPFQYTVKETPRRARLSFKGDEKPISQPNFTPNQNSPLKASPKKAYLETPRHGGFGVFEDHHALSQPNFTPGHNSPLKSSPKKGIFGTSFSQPPEESTSTPFKSRSLLLQSPAKRIASPFKSSLFSSVIGTRSLPPMELGGENDQAMNENRDNAVDVDSPPRRSEQAELADMDIEQDDSDNAFSEDLASPEVAAPENVAENELEESQHASMGDESADELPEYRADDHEDQPAVLLDEQFEHLDNEDDRAFELQNEPANEDVGLHSDELDNGTLDAEIENSRAASLAEESFSQQNDDQMGEVLDNGCDHEAEDYADGYAEHADIVHDLNVQDLNHAPNMGNEYDPDATESEPEEEEPVTHETYGNGEVEAELEQPASPFQQNTEGLEDVFVDTDMVPEEENEGPEVGSEVGDLEDLDPEDGEMSQHQHNEEYVDFHDEVYFDDDEATLVAFDTTDHYIYDVQPDAQADVDEAAQEEVELNDEVENQPTVQNNDQANIEADGEVDVHEDVYEEVLADVEADKQSEPRSILQPESERRSSPIVEQARSPLHAETPSPNHAVSYQGPMEYREDEDVSDAEATTEIQMPATNASEYSEPSNTMNLYSQEEDVFTAPSKRSRFTLLAEQLSQWKASTPEKPQPRRAGRRGVFSLGGLRRSSRRASRVSGEVAYPDLEGGAKMLQVQSLNRPRDSEVYAGVPDIFEDQNGQDLEEHEVEVPMSKSHREPMSELFSEPQLDSAQPAAYEEFLNRQSANSSDQAKNAATSPSILLEGPSDENKENEAMASPRPVTPIKKQTNPLQSFHTVSKVPLKPEGHVSPLKLSRKRGRSLSMTSPVRSSPRLRKPVVAPKEKSVLQFSPRKAPKLQRTDNPRARPSDPRRSSVGQAVRRSTAPSASPSPSKTPRKSLPACEQVLGGAVVFVDVHTTEGEDASGIFVELLQQMGARCVKSWGWNPRASMCPADGADRRDSKIGITHVVFKDGGVRTLEKVRQSRGLVKCVGVGWVLDCERENKWLDETHYAVDSSIIPRGGAKRRKSMEPRALSNVNGTVVKADNAMTTSASGRRSGVGLTTMEDFKRLTPPVSQEEPSTPQSNKKFAAIHTEADQNYCQTPKTPGISGYDFSRMDSMGMSPATPFYLSQKSKLVQQTCPPKQTRQGLFSTSSSSLIDDEPSQKLRFKLEAARRKSLAFKPKVGSPLIK
ncbi:uncharacterized protein ACLA_048070 [Aspergillus clavatus NRRL 1]|uniref:BRCT domain-containing protein n=1 Tax=Aspergillus clavatus (strain ATCC 1007 / CBS 513.65 / DSM 816 / NCTC 3887 / NRRL 1 / QM 1276 / 107) TaxID=344612 RepID=A1CHI3_ASPCL|nr:uncharacterized protein ACLA_048070 [Aspergillus clavatus NRRL 1]EAW10338.1 conserved hypothetical protein [Aspergillus clavatus NRRL 1]